MVAGVRKCGHPQVEQLLELQLLQELPPPPEGIWSNMLRSELARDTNLDMARPDRVLHLGHSASSSAFDRGRSFSNLVWHSGQTNS